MNDLETLPDGIYSYARAINDQGQMAGYGTIPGYTHAFLYSDGAVIDLGTLPGDPNSFAYGINNGGQVVGYKHFLDGPRLPVLGALDQDTNDLPEILLADRFQEDGAEPMHGLRVRVPWTGGGAAKEAPVPIAVIVLTTRACCHSACSK
jgi:probable HAF family extracellular repeat protein